MKQTDSSIRRFRVRLSLADHTTLDYLINKSGHRTRAAVVRAALTLLQRLMDARTRDGLELVLTRPDTGEIQPADDVLLPELNRTHPADHTPAGFLELRLTPGDVARFEHIEQMTGETVWADILRRAIDSYRITCDWYAKGCQPAARTAHGDLIDLWHAELMPRAARVSGKTRGKARRASRTEPDTGTADLLPPELAAGLAALARSRGMEPGALLAELVRRELEREPEPAAKTPVAEETSGEVPFTFFESGSRRTAAHREVDAQPAETTPPESTQNLQESTLPVPAESREGWALVVACDSDGNPDKQVVPADSVVPLEDEDLEGFAGYEDPFLW
jgi:Arc/MetJ-type ribon-helix-helix transcriptional regulator